MKPCKCCGEIFSLDNFYTDNGLPDKKRNICKECAKAKTREWKANNLKRKRASNLYYEDFKRDKKRKSELAKIRNKTIQAKFKMKCSRKRRLINFNSKRFNITDKDLRRLMRSSCWNCKTYNNQTFDHIIPLSRGGSHGIGNIMILCQTCNLSKHASTIMEWKISGRAEYIARSNQTWQE